MAVKADKSRVAAYIPSDLKEKAEQIAAADHRSLSSLIEIALERVVSEGLDKSSA